MAENWVDVDLSQFADQGSQNAQDLANQTEQQNAPVSWGDYGKSLEAGTYQLGQGLLGGVDYLGKKVNLQAAAPEFMKGVAEEKQSLGQDAEDVTKTMTPRAQRDTQASIFDAPDTMSSLKLKATGMLPSLIAGLVPGGIVARAAAAAGMSTGAAATLGAAAGSVPQSVSMGGDVYNEIEKGIQDAPDKELQDQSSVYRGLRSMGMSEPDAKDHLVQQAAGYKPLIMMGVSELVGRMGTEGMLAAKAAGQDAGQSILKGVTKNTAEEGGKQAALSGTQDVLTQTGKMDSNDNLDFHWKEALTSAAEGGVLGAVTGAPMGAVLHGGKHTEGEVAPKGELPQDKAVSGDDQAALDAVKPQDQAPAPTTAFDKGPPIAGAPEMAAADEHVTDEEEQPAPVQAAIPAPTGQEIAPSVPEKPIQTSDVGDVSHANGVLRDGFGGLNWANSLPLDVQRIVRRPDVSEALVNPQFDASKHVPYLAGSNIHDSKTDVDSHIPRTDPSVVGADGKPLDLWKFVNIHEQVEKALREAGHDYAGAHDMATSAELAAVKAAGGDPAAYQAFWKKQASFVEHEAKVNMPNDLYVVDKGEAGKAADGQTIEAPAGQPTDEAQANKTEAADRNLAPRVLVDLTAQETAKADAAAQAKAGPRTSAAEREAVAKGEGASQTLSRDPEAWKTQKDRRAASRILETELKLAEKESRQPADWAKMLASARGKMQGKGAKADSARAAWQEGRRMLDELQGKAIDAGKTARATKEATRPDVAAAKQERAEKKATQAELAKHVLDANPIPKDAVVNRRSMLKHVTDTLDAAKKSGVELPERVTEGVGGHVAHLMDAKALKERLEGVLSRGSMDSLQPHLSSFTANSHLLKGGHEEEVLANRRVEATKTEASFTEDKPGSATDHTLDNREDDRVEAAPQEGMTTNPPEGMTDHPDEVYQELTPRERPAVQVDVNKDVTAGQDRAGKFQVATTGRRRFATSAGSRLSAASAKRLSHAPRATGRMHAAGEHYDLGEGLAGRAVASKSLKEVLDAHANAYTQNPIMGFFARRLNEMVPNTRIHFLNSEDMRAVEHMTSSPESDAMFVRNHETGRNAIFVDMAKAALGGSVEGDKWMARIGVHEGLHAAFHSLIESRPDIKGEIHSMMNHVDNHLPPHEMPYGMTNAHEFISEAFSNPDFQKILAKIEAPPEPGSGKLRNVFQWLIAAIRRGLNMPRGYESMLERVVKFSDSMIASRASELNKREGKSFAAASSVSSSPREAAEGTKSISDHVGDLALRSGLKSLAGKATRYVTTTGQYAQHVAPRFRGEGEGNIINKIHRLVERQGVLAGELRERGIDLAADLIRDQKANPELFERKAKLINDATRMGVDPSSPLGAGRNTHLAVSQKLQARLKKGEKWADIAHEAGLNGWAARGAHPDLAKDYRWIVGQDGNFAKRMQDIFSYFHDVQNDISRRHIEGFLRADEKFAGDVPATARDYNDSQLTQELKDKLRKTHGDAIADAIIGAKKLSPRNGPYAPLMRRGDWVVRGRYGITDPGNATKIDDNTFEFATRKEAHQYAESTGLDYDVDTRYYDPTTGALTTKIGGESSAGSPIQKYRVKLNREHMELFPSQWEATQAYRDYSKDKTFDKVVLPQEKRNLNQAGSELTAGSVATLEGRLKKTKAYEEASPHQQEEMLRSLREAAIAVQSGNRVQSRRLPRRNVAGASTDLVQNIHDYNISQANFRAKQQYRPQVDQAIKDMRQEVKDREYEPGTEDRSVAANEMETRARAEDPAQYSGAASDWGRRIAMVNFVDRMGRASHLLLHEFHLPMITAPVIGARHGYAQTLAMLASNWNRARGAYSKGGRGFIESLRNPLTKSVDYHSYMKKAFGDDAGVAKMLDTLHKDGVIHSGMGVEIGKYAPSAQAGNVAVRTIDKVFGRMDTVYRHLNDAFDAVIRYVGATSAYKLERQKLTDAGKSAEEAHEGATEYARNIVANTQGHYSSTNAAPIFKNKALRPFLQFKQFPQMMYHLLIQNGIKAFKGATGAEKAEGAKALIGVLATHTAMAGVLGGLPMELPRMVGALTKGLGITNNDWSDVEESARQHLRDLLGPMMGGIAANGLSRAIGFDAHHRLGLNSFFTFGLPQNANGDKWSDFILNSSLGAPYGLAQDTLSGLHKIMQGDVVDGITRAFPLQFLRDVQLAAQGGNASYQYSPAERVFQALGFTPSGKAEMNEEVGREIGAAARKKDARSQLVRQFFNATTDEARRDIIAQINEYNKSATGLSRIGIKGLQARLVARQQTQNTAKEAW